MRLINQLLGVDNHQKCTKQGYLQRKSNKWHRMKPHHQLIINYNNSNEWNKDTVKCNDSWIWIRLAAESSESSESLWDPVCNSWYICYIKKSTDILFFARRRLTSSRSKPRCWNVPFQEEIQMTGMINKTEKRKHKRGHPSMCTCTECPHMHLTCLPSPNSHSPPDHRLRPLHHVISESSETESFDQAAMGTTLSFLLHVVIRVAG